MTYFIKNIWGPGGQKGYPEDGIIHFSNKRSAERFVQCEGFFIYETGNKEDGIKGAKAIFAEGVVKNPKIFETSRIHPSQKRFPYYVKIILNKKVNPNYGVPLSEIKKTLNSPNERMQRWGGLISITKIQFDKISLKL